MIKRLLQEIYPGIEILSNRRPDSLRSSKNRPLEIDILIPSKEVAIEIQGPQHFRTVYGDNSRLLETDKQKKDWCNQQGIKLIWMNLEGIAKELFRKPAAEQSLHLRNLIQSTMLGSNKFVYWIGVNEQICE